MTPVLLCALPAVVALLVWRPDISFPLSMALFAVTASQTPSIISIGLLSVGLLGLASALCRSTRLHVAPALVLWICVLGAMALVQIWQYQDGHEVMARYVALAAALSIAFTILLQGRQQSLSRAAVVVYLVLVLLEAALGMLQFAAHSPVLGGRLVTSGAIQAAQEIPGMFRACGTFAHPNAYGIFMAFAIPILLAARRHEVGAYRWVFLAAVSVAMAAAFASLSRSAALAVITGFGCWAISNRRYLSPARKTVMVLASLLVVAAVFVGPFSRFGTGGDVAARDHSSNSARMANMTAAYRAWTLSPMLGQGLGTGAKFDHQYGGYTDLGAHDTYLDILSGGGIILMGLLMVTMVWVGPGALRAWRQGSPMVIGFSLVMILGIFESLLQSGLVVLVGAVFAMVVSVDEPKPDASMHAVSAIPHPAAQT